MPNGCAHPCANHWSHIKVMHKTLSNGCAHPCANHWLGSSLVLCIDAYAS